MRKSVIPQSSTLTYLLGDHLGSTSLAVDASTGEVVETRYKPWGEVRYTTPNKTLPTRFTFTGQYSYVNDEATDLGNVGFGLMYYNARWVDPQLGRFTQPDTIIPEQSQGTQAWDRFAYVSNNPVKLIDPTGHKACDDESDCDVESGDNTSDDPKITSGDKPQYSPKKDDICIQQEDGGFACGYWITKKQAADILTQLWTDQLLTIGTFAGMGALIGFVAGTILSGGNPVIGAAVAVVVAVVFAVIGAVASHNYDQVYDEIQTASDSTPDGEMISVIIGRADSKSPTKLKASGYDSVSVSDAPLESIIKATGINVPNYYSPFSTPTP